MKAPSMNTSTTPTGAAALPPELIQTGLQNLTEAHSVALASIAGELRTNAASKPPEEPPTNKQENK